MKSSVKQIVFDWVIPVVITLLGTATAAAGLYFFLIPTTISPGGVSGMSIIIQTLKN